MKARFLIGCSVLISTILGASEARAQNLSLLALDYLTGQGRASSFRYVGDDEMFREGFMKLRAKLKGTDSSGASHNVRVVFDFQDGIGVAIPVMDSAVLFLENRIKMFADNNNRVLTFKWRY